MKILSCLLASFPVLLLSCGSGESTPTPDEVPIDQDVVEVPADAVEYKAMCGCSIEGIAGCGNYVDVDGEWIVLEHPSLGSMEWCGDKEAGATVKVAGEMMDGKLVATYYERVD